MSPNRLAALAAAWALSLAGAPAALAEGDVGLAPVTDVKGNSPKEELRLRLFKDAPGKAACGVVKIDPRGVTGGLDAELDTFLQQLIAGLKSKNDKALQPLFHQRLNVGLKALQETLAKLDFVYGAPLDVSIYRLWALNSVDGSPTGLACDDDRLTVYPVYGYPLQFAVWLQIMGQKELGRIYLAVVPANGRWNIGAFNAQQWTHDGRDFATWAEDAEKAANMGYKEASYIKYDIAAKLLEGGSFLNIAMRDDILKARERVLPTDAWQKSLRAALKDYDVPYVAPLLVVGGSGVLARIRLPAELAVDAIKAHCRKVAETLRLAPWAAYVEGVRCNYLMPTEDAKADGKMGGLFVPFAELGAKPAP